MLRPAFLFLSLLLFSSSALGQAATTESQTLQSLLAEVRQLRQDVQIAATSARRAQILIHRLYVQEAVVDRATQRLDEAKSGINQLRIQRNYQEGQIKSYEDARDHAKDADERKRLDNYIANFRAQLEALAPLDRKHRQEKSRWKNRCESSRRSLTSYRTNWIS